MSVSAIFALFNHSNDLHAGNRMRYKPSTTTNLELVASALIGCGAFISTVYNLRPYCLWR